MKDQNSFSIKKYFTLLQVLYDSWRALKFMYIDPLCRKKYGYRASDSMVFVPTHISTIKNVFMYEQSRIQAHAKIITHTGKFIMNKYSGAAPGLTVITGNHTPTVGIPHYLLPVCRINDKEKDVIVKEDVWIGANVTLLSGVTIGRGALIGACSVVTRDIPPYAVVAGNPARIIKAKFTPEEIIEHESILYPQKERFDKDYLEEVFATYFKNKTTVGVRMTKTNKQSFEQFIKDSNND